MCNGVSAHRVKWHTQPTNTPSQAKCNPLIVITSAKEEEKEENKQLKSQRTYTKRLTLGHTDLILSGV